MPHACPFRSNRILNRSHVLSALAVASKNDKSLLEGLKTEHLLGYDSSDSDVDGILDGPELEAKDALNASKAMRATTQAISIPASKSVGPSVSVRPAVPPLPMPLRPPPTKSSKSIDLAIGLKCAR